MTPPNPDTSTGYPEAPEATHAHFCPECASVWTHTEDHCPGPVFEHFPVTLVWECPDCLEAGAHRTFHFGDWTDSDWIASEAGDTLPPDSTPEEGWRDEL